MTDEKLDQILKQALAPEIDDSEIRIHKRRKDKMGIFKKIGTGVAAAVAAAGNLDTSDYTVSDKGITLTASEAYCDGYSIFLTVNIESEDADFTHIPRHYTGMNIADDKTAAGFYIDGKWRVDGRSDEWLENTFDGEVIDSHTFAGMLKINSYFAY